MGRGRIAASGVVAVLAALTFAPGAGASGCDPVDPSACLLPWPNDHFTRSDPGTPTGRRLDLTDADMPRNAQGVPIAASDYDAADGFSPGAALVTRFPGLDSDAALARTGAVPETDLARYRDERAPIVVIDAQTGRRHPIWAEVDHAATSDATRDLLIHPAVNFTERHRYVVALRWLRGADGRALRPSPAFRCLRDGLPACGGALAGRRAHVASLLRTLRRAGIRRRSLDLAWDFTVASARTLASRMLAIRDDAFATLGDRRLGDLKVQGRPPAFDVGQVQDFTPAQNPDIRRRVSGTVEVPCYLSQPGCPPGSRFVLDPRGRPVRTPGNVQRARFICNIPRSATAAHPGRIALYGHGLFGTAEEVDSVARGDLARTNGVVLCATDWAGMSGGDLPNTFGILRDLSQFPTLADRLQQGFLDFLFLGRALVHPGGFAANAAFQDGGAPLLDTRRLFFAGGSQGGILGGAVSAVAPDWTRAALIVPGMTYSTLLTRSVDFDAFSALLYPSYPNEVERPLILSLIQGLWDRGDPDGYAQHLTRDPYRDTPRHDVLLHMAFGDHQVANVTTQVEARTIGARLRTPALDPGRSADVQPFWGIPRLRPGESTRGSALVVWDIGPLRPPGCGAAGAPSCLGTPAPPVGNSAPRVGVDPHGITGRNPLAQQQFSAFLALGGRFVDVCGTSPCYAGGWTGPTP